MDYLLSFCVPANTDSQTSPNWLKATCSAICMKSISECVLLRAVKLQESWCHCWRPRWDGGWKKQVNNTKAYTHFFWALAKHFGWNTVTELPVDITTGHVCIWNICWMLSLSTALISLYLLTGAYKYVLWFHIDNFISFCFYSDTFHRHVSWQLCVVTTFSPLQLPSSTTAATFSPLAPVSLNSNHVYVNLI